MDSSGDGLLIPETKQHQLPASTRSAFTINPTYSRSFKANNCYMDGFYLLAELLSTTVTWRLPYAK